MHKKPEPPTNLTLHFALEELACRCRCGGEHQPSIMQQLLRLATALEKLRTLAGGIALMLTCAFRCIRHNAKVGGAPGSEHTRGIAADVAAADQIKLAALASQVPEIGGIGLYPGQGIIHVDLRPRRDGLITWWECVNGDYIPLRPATRKALLAAGAKGL